MIQENKSCFVEIARLVSGVIVQMGKKRDEKKTEALEVGMIYPVVLEKWLNLYCVPAMSCASQNSFVHATGLQLLNYLMGGWMGGGRMVGSHRAVRGRNKKK